MRVSSITLKELAKLGANIELTKECGYNSITIKEIIKIVVQTQKQITIHAGSYSSISLKEFVKLGNGNVTIVFS